MPNVIPILPRDQLNDRTVSHLPAPRAEGEVRTIQVIDLAPDVEPVPPGAPVPELKTIPVELFSRRSRDGRLVWIYEGPLYVDASNRTSARLEGKTMEEWVKSCIGSACVSVTLEGIENDTPQAMVELLVG